MASPPRVGPKTKALVATVGAVSEVLIVAWIVGEGIAVVAPTVLGITNVTSCPVVTGVGTVVVTPKSTVVGEASGVTTVTVGVQR